jgi:hypothetical protein
MNQELLSMVSGKFKPKEEALGSSIWDPTHPLMGPPPPPTPLQTEKFAIMTGLGQRSSEH